MKKITLFLALILLGSTAYAQDHSNRGKGNKIIRGPYETNRFFDNWVIGVGGGINIYQGNSDKHLDLGKRISTALDLSVSKWITPAFGLRIQYSGFDARGTSGLGSPYSTTILSDGFYNEEFYISNLHADLLLNLSNVVSGYRKDRRWNVIPFIGVGWVRTWNKTSNINEYATTFGILNTVRLSNVIDLTIEGRHMIASTRLDGVTCVDKYDGMSSVAVGLSFKLGERYFKRVVTPNYAPYNKQIKGLRAQNLQLKAISAELAKKLDQANNRAKDVIAIVKTEVSVNTTPVALFFKIGRSTLDGKELANLDFYVKNAIAADKNKVFTIIGTADSATGNDELNQRLSEKRMQYVFDILTNNYHISASRLVKKAEGDSNNRFDRPELNRTVILK